MCKAQSHTSWNARGYKNRPLASFEHVLRTYDPIPYVFDLNDRVGQIPCADVVKGGLEEFSLKSGRDIGNNNNDPWMQWLLAEERKKIRAIVGYKRVVPLAGDWQQ